MLNDIVALTKELVAIRSTPDNPKALDEILELTLKNLKGFTVEKFIHNGAKSILVYNTPNRPKKFKVILNGHLDIIPGKDYQYSPKIKGNKLYGVGSMDMKSSVASYIVVFNEIAKQVDYPLAIQLVTDEEIGGFNGTKYQIDQGVRTDFAIVGETTNFTIENQTKGIMWLKISSKGKAAHGAYPWQGENAIWKMNHFLNELEKTFPNPKQEEWITTINLAKIETNNTAFNKVPDHCEISLDIRYIPADSETVLKKIEKILPDGFRLELITKEPAQFVDGNNSFIDMLQKTSHKITKKQVPLVSANGSSDARHFARVNCNAIEFGPIGKGMGTDDEYVDIKSLEEYANIIKSFLLNLTSHKFDRPIPN
jgi:succinyl-diaminopimelate desuccinylase